MAINNRRNRVLLCRLTQDEYNRVQAASAGARSLSDFARARLLGVQDPPAVDSQITELKLRVDRIEELLEKD
jgi:hypothetical protein